MTALVAVLLTSALASVGCGQPEIKQLNNKVWALETEKKTLQAQYDDSRKQLLASQTASTGLKDQLDEKDTEIDSIKAERDKALSDLDAAKKAPPDPGPGKTGSGGGMIGAEFSLGSDVLFSSGRATLTTAGKRALDGIASSIQSQYPGKNIRVYGHTDSDRIKKTKNLWSDNLDLSSNRAMAVTRYLIVKGITASLIESVGMGATRPIAGNKTAADKKKNRRVEIVVIK